MERGSGGGAHDGPTVSTRRESAVGNPLTAAGPATTGMTRSSSGNLATAANSSSRSGHGSGRGSSYTSSAAPTTSSGHRGGGGGGGDKGASGSGGSGHGLSRRNSGNEGSTSRSERDSRDYRDSRSSRDARDSRDSRESRSSRGRSRSRDSREHRSERGSSSSSAPTSGHFSTSGSPAVRLREHNNILVMHRTATRRSNLSAVESATRVLGLDMGFMRDPDNPNVSEKLGTPGYFPTSMSLPEEKFRFHAVRNAAFVNPLPRGFGTNWHLQYSFFTDTKFPVFDEVAQAATIIERIQSELKEGPKKALVAPGTTPPDHVFTSYLIRNVRRIDERISHQWMCELASGKKTIQELVQSYGIPFKQWRPMPNVSKCPLLEYVVRYRPGFAEATWFIRINVIYVEMNEIKRDSVYRQGDWFHNPRRIQRRAYGWTEQLVDFIHSLARQTSKTRKLEVDAATRNRVDVIVKSSSTESRIASVRNHRNGEIGMCDGAAQAPQPASSVPPSLSQLSFHEKWSYTLKLAEYQFKAGLLDRSKFFEGLVSLFQKVLSPRGRSGNTMPLLPVGVNEALELVAVVHNLLPEILRCPESVIILVKSSIQHLRYLMPPASNIPQVLGSPLQEELVCALCQMLRDILLNGFDLLVRLDENGPATWPPYVLSSRFFDHSVYGPKEIDDCVNMCQYKSAEVTGRSIRLQQAHPSAFNLASLRNEAQVIQSLDRFHRVDAGVDLQRVYDEIFIPFPPECTELPVDVAAIFAVCEWAVTSHRPGEYRFLSALSLLEMHSKALLEFGKEKRIVDCADEDHQLVLQCSLQSFLQRYEPKSIGEITQVIDLFCLLVRRRIFSVESFVEFAACAIEASCHSVPPVLSPGPGRPMSNGPSAATVVSTAYNIECAPGRGYKSSDMHLLSVPERLRLYLWQLPRGPFPLPVSIAMLPEDTYDSEVCLLRWLDVMELRQEHLLYSKTLERAQSLCVYVFHTHGEANDSNDVTGKDRVVKEVDYQGKVGELVSAVKTMCGHDKGRFTLWFLKNVYEDPAFFRFSEFGSVEHVVRLVCLVFEIVDILALLEVLIYFLRNSPVFLVKNVVLAMIERHEIAFCATGQIPLLMQTFVDRFHRLSKAADDKTGSVAKFFCRMYYAHAKKKEIGKLDLPIALLRPIAETARKNQEGANKQKELSLEATNPIVRIPPARETIPPEVKSALSRSFKVLQAKSFDSTGDKQIVTTPLTSPDSQGSLNSATEPAFEAPSYATMSWKEIVCESSSTSESRSRDAAIDFAATAINMSMSVSVGATNANATRERRTPNYVFFLRAILSEAMDKWMANLSARVKINCRRPLMTPHYIHRCVRLIREVIDQHPDGEDFQEKFSNTLVVWLQKEVLPGFAGSETQKRVRNPFINVENGKEAFLLNQKGRLDKLQYGLKAFLISLIVHKVLDLPQVLRLVLVPLFPRLRRASRDPPPNLPSQLLAMALVFQLFSEPPQHVPIEPQKFVMFDEPLTKYHLRFMRTQVPASLMFPLVHLLCQISYQMEENFTLRKREERGTLASITLFNLTSDGIVRDIIFHDTKEAREKHILPVYHKKQWHTAVLLTHFFRPPNSPAEDANGQVQLLKVDQIIDQMTVWVLHRGGSIYLDLQMSRQQLKVKRASKSSVRNQKRKAQTEQSGRSSKRLRDDDRGYKTTEMNGMRQHRHNSDHSFQDAESSDEAEFEIEFDETSSATEILANLIVVRTLKKSTRPSWLANSTLCSVATSASPQLTVPSIPFCVRDGAPPNVMDKRSSWMHLAHNGTGSQVEKEAAMAESDSHEAAVASLYAATVCSISRRAMGSVIARILQVLEEDVKYSIKDKFARKINGTTVVRLICGIMCTQPGSAFLPRYMMSLSTQLESLYEGAKLYDQDPERFDFAFLRRLRRKLAVRLQLVGVVGQSKHIAVTICYRDRIAKTLFYLLGTSAVSRDVGLSLFSWILDLIPQVNASVLHSKQQELVDSLNLPSELEQRIWAVLPRSALSTATVYLRDTISGDQQPVDPWGVLEHIPQRPSDDLMLAIQEQTPKRRRTFCCV